MFEKQIIVDAKGHLLGRLASIVAKQILRGQKIVVVRCESINISGSLFRNNLKFKEFMGYTRLANPRRGHVHYRNPARIFWRAVRNMTPHKTARGTAALGRLKCFEGIPHPYDEQKRMVVPQAMKVLRLRTYRKFCSLGDLAKKAGWNKQELVEQLEEKRKEKSKTFYEAKQKKLAARAKTSKNKDVQQIETELAKYGF